MAKRTPERVEEARRLRAEGRSWRDIAETISRKGKPVTEGAIRQWLREGRDADAPPGPSAAPLSAPEAGPEAAEPLAAPPGADAELTPDELRMVLSRAIREAEAAARSARASGDYTEAKAQRRFIAMFAAQLRQIHNKADEDTETVRVKASDIQAAADRAMAGLQQTADAVVAALEQWDGGEFGGGEVSVVRALFERVARAGVMAGRMG